MQPKKRSRGKRARPNRPLRIAALLPAGPEYSGRLLEGAISYAEGVKGLELVDLPYDLDEENPLDGMDLDFDGAMVWLRPQDDWIKLLLAAGKVVVNTSGDRSLEEIPVLAFQGSSAVNRAVEHLAGLDRSHAAYIGAEISTSSALSWRVDLFCKQCREKGMTTHVLELGAGGKIDDRRARLSGAQEQSLRKFLDSLPLPSVVWCDEDFIARQVCDAAALLGKEVPKEIAVLGFYDYRIARMSQPTLSSIPQPGQEIGRKAVEWIHQSLRGGEPCKGEVALPSPPVQVRETTGLGKDGDQVYRQAMKLIREHACGGLTVNELMNMVSVSQRTFSQRFTELYGLTPGAQIREVRINRAKQYLKASSMGVERIAISCGFEQAGKFSTFFKRETGMTPSEFRKNGKK